MLSIKIDDDELLILDCKCSLVKTLRGILLSKKAKDNILISGLNKNVNSKQN